MKTLRSAALTLMAGGLLVGFVTPIWAEDIAAGGFHKLACASYPSSSSPWHVNNLYDCRTRELFVPYQLWTGAKWDGRKDGPCMHKADNTFSVNDRSLTRISGPKKWRNPKTDKEEMVWVREKVQGWKEQYFTCHEKGVGRLYDSRRPRYYRNGRCKFPAGNGWKVGVRRDCRSTSIEITPCRPGRDWPPKGPEI